MTDISDPQNHNGLGKAEPPEKFKPKRQLAGSAELVGDLEKTSTEITDSILESIAQSAKEPMP